MTTRRDFLAASTAATALGLAARPSIAREKSDDGTWLTYAVNVEMTWTNLPFLDRLRKVKESGFSHYEFWPWRNKDIDAIKKLNDELGLVPEQFTSSPKRFDQGITDPNRRDEFVEDVRLAIDVAKKLGVKKLCVVAGEETKGYSRDEQTRAVIAAFKAAAESVEKAGITLILEPLNVLVNHPKQLVVTSDHAAQIINAVGSPNVRILFDVYHQQISEGNLTGNIRKYKDLIGYYQIADHPGRHEPYTGEIRYAHVLKVIHDVGYKGAIGMELSPAGDPKAAFEAVRKADAESKALDKS